MKELGLIQKNFQTQKGEYASCSISYLYSKESAPHKYLDSLPGLYKSSGNTRYTKIGNTEAIENDSVAVAVFNDSKTIMTSPVSAERGNDQGLFLNKIDSAFVGRNSKTVTIVQKSGIKTMTFLFTDSSQYYNCIVVYDAKTYIPQTISYILRDTKLSESGKPPGDGGVITLRFTGYTHSAFDASLLNVSKYVNIAAGQKNALQPAYRGYNLYQKGNIQKQEK
jgi:hypothetical protein